MPSVFPARVPPESAPRATVSTPRAPLARTQGPARSRASSSTQDHATPLPYVIGWSMWFAQEYAASQDIQPWHSYK
ncbi:hypothetical protein ABZP36_021913 [Zizania latifolia]